jgi:hypothetical protein
MNYRAIQPPNALRGYVVAFWTLECGNRAVADCCPELMFHYSGCFDELIPNGAPILSFASGLHAASDRIRRFRIEGSEFWRHDLSVFSPLPPLRLSRGIPV